MLKSFANSTSLGFMFLLLGSITQAQIVNVEAKRGAIDEQEGWHGNINFNLSFQRNTSDILTYGNKSTIQWQKNKHRLLLLTDLSRVQAAGADFVNQGFWHGRYNYHLDEKKRVSLEVFQQMQFNSVQLIQFRYLTGAGLGWNVLERDSLKFRVGTLPMYEYEELTTNVIERNFRQSTYVLLFFKLNMLEFQSINYYQPKITELSDYRFSSSSTIEFTLRKWLKYNVSFDLLYDSKVPATIPDLVFTLRNGLGVEF
ncbi:DUF481 domain-containing protein [Salibacteraceae bacterium]|nr:DUF481 domain-containing protein [Salibacteraceae bacterium]